MSLVIIIYLFGAGVTFAIVSYYAAKVDQEQELSNANKDANLIGSMIVSLSWFIALPLAMSAARRNGRSFAQHLRYVCGAK